MGLFTKKKPIEKVYIAFQKKKYRKAIKLCDKILKENPNNVEVLKIKSDAYAKRDKLPEAIGFDYTNRHGAYAGWRIVEPHYTFYAYTTGNLVLVTWDRDVQDIRAFIVGNIHPNGVRYEGETFSPKPEIMRGISSV